MRFDDLGRSHYYHEYLQAYQQRVLTGEPGWTRLEQLAESIRKDGKGKKYDSILGLSGGVDSTYVAYLAKQLGLRPLAVHFDNGWDSELAVKNIENIVRRLDLDLYTYVIDWDEFKDLQLAYLKASVVDIEVITDHAIFATMYRLAAKHGIRHLLSGTNVVTEQVLPPHWIFVKTDHVNIQAIHRSYGTAPLRTFPFMDVKVKKYHQLLQGIRSHSVLDSVDYQKDRVKKLIAKELDWRDYGGKHYESVFTRFYQGYILPRKFGIDKRKAHLSNLIFAGQLSKQEALQELQKPIYEPKQLERDYDYVIKKLGLSADQFEDLMRLPPRKHTDFEYERAVYDRFPILRPLRGTAELVSRLAGKR